MGDGSFQLSGVSFKPDDATAATIMGGTRNQLGQSNESIVWPGVASKSGSMAQRSTRVREQDGRSARIFAAASCSGWSARRSTARASTSLTRSGALSRPSRKSTLDCCHRLSYKCLSNAQRHGGPPPSSLLYGANTGFSSLAYIRHEKYCTVAIARPTVSTDHKGVQMRCMSGAITPYVVIAWIQRNGRAGYPLK